MTARQMSMDKRGLKDLRDRVAKLTGPMGYADAEDTAPRLAAALGSKGEFFSACNRALQGSIDAVEGLRRHVLPGSSIDIQGLGGDFDCYIHPASGGRYGVRNAPTEPLARLLALLDVLIAQGNDR